MTRTKKSNDGYGIGAVARITGLTDHTIRVWERRYKAVVARRSETGRRIYTAANVEKLGLLKQLTDKGIAISKIAGKSNTALRNAVLEYEQVATTSVPETVRVAVLGDHVLTQLNERDGSFDLLVADNNPTRFSADLEKQVVDVVILERAVLDGKAIKHLKSYLSLGRARCGLLVYHFGQRRDVERANTSRTMAFRSPVGARELQAAIHNLLAGTTAPSPVDTERAAHSTDPAWRFSGTVAPRNFTQQQLARLANISSSIECECPQNLAQLVSDLTAFEIYSSECANRDSDDAALHHYLHQTTAEARQLIEKALLKVVATEGISL
jgi:DNA-binding transcriptional MerR regulator